MTVAVFHKVFANGHCLYTLYKQSFEEAAVEVFTTEARTVG